MNSVRTFVLNIFKFLGFSTLFYLVFLFLWAHFLPPKYARNVQYQRGNAGHLYSRLKEVKNHKNVDILFLGSSHTYRGFDPRIFAKQGYRTFNLGSSSQTPLQTELLLNRHLGHLKPKLIIYEVYPVTFELDGVESSLDMIANHDNDGYSFQMVMKINQIKTYNTFLYGCMLDFMNFNSHFKESKDIPPDHYISGGYVQRDIKPFEAKEIFNRKVSMLPKQTLVFDQIVKEIKSKNIPLLLIYAPITQKAYKEQSHSSSFEKFMKKRALYIDFNQKLELEDSIYFYDSHHLNQRGVERFNEKLIETLKALGYEPKSQKN